MNAPSTRKGLEASTKRHFHSRSLNLTALSGYLQYIHTVGHVGTLHTICSCLAWCLPTPASASCCCFIGMLSFFLLRGVQPMHFFGYIGSATCQPAPTCQNQRHVHAHYCCTGSISDNSERFWAHKKSIAPQTRSTIAPQTRSTHC